jgi:hypothetical protein
LRDEEALIAADAADGAEAEDTEEPIPDRAMGVVEGFGVAGGTGLSVGKHWHLSAVMCPKFKFGGNHQRRIRRMFFDLAPNWE